MSEGELIRRARLGDGEAIETLFNKHAERAVRLAYLVVRDWQAAEDAAQEAFVRAFRSVTRFRDGKPFAPWFFRIVVNQAKKVLRRNRRLIFTEIVTSGEDRSAEETALGNERKRLIWEAVGELDENHRLPVLLKYFSGFPYSDIATILNIPEKTVKSRLFTARRRLKEALREGDAEHA